jgi:hypothetical protein
MRGSVRCAVCRAGTNSVIAQTARLSDDVAPLSGLYNGILTTHPLWNGSQKHLDSIAGGIAGGKIRRTHCCGRAE